MMMSDEQIRAACAAGELVIEPFSEESLQGSSYDARIGSRALLGGSDAEIDVADKGAITVKPGEFVLMVTREKFRLNPDIAGHLGVRSYFSRKGFVILAGLQIDPGFEGHLVIGGYNAAPRRLTLDYEAPFLTVEFHRLSHPATKRLKGGAEQRSGHIPRIDKDYLRTLETQSLSDVSEELRKLAVNVGEMEKWFKYFYAPVLLIILAAVVGFGLTR
ncbi:MAG: dCTP deaminase domain-containing protein [Alphaproteobacteria bacterium]